MDLSSTSIHQNEGLGEESEIDSALMPCERRVVVKIGCEPKIDRDLEPVTGRVEPLLWATFTLKVYSYGFVRWILYIGATFTHRRRS